MLDGPVPRARYRRGPAAGQPRDVLDGRFTIDTTRKQIAGDDALWTLRLRDRNVLGQAEVDFRDGLVAQMFLGPTGQRRSATFTAGGPPG